jgi:hypothetical protein
MNDQDISNSVRRAERLLTTVYCLLSTSSED